MFRVITFNANGIRSAIRKGFFDWLHTQNADVVCLQETKAQLAALDLNLLCPLGYRCHYDDAGKKGYSGVAIYCKRPPDHVVQKLGWPSADDEGRFVQVDYGKLSVVSLYLPSGTSGEIRQAVKYDFLDRMIPILQQMRQSQRSFIICGDWNIAHKQIDLKNWRANQVHSGFLPEERAWMDRILGELGLVDAFRIINQQAEQYTWWSHRGRAWEKNVGWRIDYQMITPDLREQILQASIYKDQRFSDHAPLIMDYDLTI